MWLHGVLQETERIDLNAAPIKPVITAADRFSLTLCLAIIAHATLILGVGFKGEDDQLPRNDSMEIILVTQQDLEPVEDAKLLAQANLAGGGDTEEQIPATPLPPPFPDQAAEITAPPELPMPPVEPSPAQEPTSELPEPAAADEPQLAAQAEDARLPDTDSEPQKKRKKEVPETISAAELLRNSLKIASLSAQIRQKLENSASRPRRTFISANTREYKYAAYMEAWRAKVERVGNLNYPDEARRQNLSGSLILDVSLNPDGSIEQVTIRRSSGKQILDDAAIRIVELASPFAPFPDNIRDNTDILHITRTWQFIDNSGFR